MIGGKGKCSHQQMTNCLSVNWFVFMFICSADRVHRPAVKAARLVINSYRLLFLILLDSKEYILSTFKSVRCSSNSVFIGAFKSDRKSLKAVGFVRRRVVKIADEQSQPKSMQGDITTMLDERPNNWCCHYANVCK